MKKVLFLTLLFLSTETFSQSNRVVQDSCGFLKDLHFNKHRVDTILIKARYDGYYKLVSLPVMKSLQKAKKLNNKDFKYAVGFIPINCSTRFGAPCRDTDGDLRHWLDKQPIGQVVYLTCVVYQGYFNFPEEVFYTVNKISVETPK
jgi:hypothetical protein